MHSINPITPALFKIGPYYFEIRKDFKATPIFCSNSINAFSTPDINASADFILTIKEKCPNKNPVADKQLSLEANRLFLDYGTNSERLCIESNFSLTHWNLYTTYKQNCIDEWFILTGNLFAWAVLGKNAFMLHGVLMEWNNKGIVLTAPSGTGKTTHAHLWREKENALIVNGDRVLLKKINEHWYAFGTPWCGSSGECINRKVSLDSIVFLSRGESNFVEKTAPISSIKKMLPRIIAPKWHKNYSKTAVELSIQCLEDIPLYDLHCLPNYKSVEVLKNALLNNI